MHDKILQFTFYVYFFIKYADLFLSLDKSQTSVKQTIILTNYAMQPLEYMKNASAASKGNNSSIPIFNLKEQLKFLTLF